MRRLTGLLTSLLLFHLTLVGTDVTCAKHGVHGGAHSTQSTSSNGHHHGTSSQHASYDQTSCEAPALPACCEALSSCGASIAVSRSDTAHDLLQIADAVRGSADDAPRSWTLEPDPPPPKA